MDISIIIPVYNGARFIDACLSSVFAFQTKDDTYEVIVVDDASTDDTPRIAQRYPVRYVRIDKGGAAKARNAGIDMSRGEILLFFDADVVLKKDTIAKFIAHFSSDLDASVIQGRWDAHAPSDSFGAEFLLLKYHFNFQGLFRRERRAIVANLETGCLGIRRKVFDVVQPFSTAYKSAGGEEHELGLRILMHYPIYYYSDIFVEHRFGNIRSAIKKIYFRTINFSMLIFNSRRKNLLNLHTVSVPRQDKISVVLLFLMTVDAAILAPLHPEIGLASAAFLLLLYGLNIAPFVGYLRRMKGLLFALRGAVSDFVIMVPRAAGLAVALSYHYLTGKRDHRM